MGPSTQGRNFDIISEWVEPTVVEGWIGVCKDPVRNKEHATTLLFQTEEAVMRLLSSKDWKAVKVRVVFDE